ncbi:MAG TPA: alpha/beta hydrolase [Actinomycetota bacterium]|jgi:pimeloyl-ACP methyl ester carboxylesterase|nr:alpha/beta hydrolase [Actinomycetota bacterium]
MADVLSTVESNGVRLAVEVVGEGEPVTVLAHGLTGSRADVAVFAPFLPGTNVLFDFRGHGDSERPPPGGYSMNDFAADVDRVAAAFGATRLAGISLGGGATLRLLRTVPDRFEKLVLLLPTRLERSMLAHTQLLRLADLLERYPVPKVADMLLEEEDRAGRFDQFPAAREFRRSVILRMNRDGIPAAIREALDDPPLGDDAEAMARVSAPALVIGQRGDPIHAAVVAEELAEALPNAELLLFDDPNALLRDIPAVVQKVAAFLDG